jgi:predicted ATPase/DNA-binding CsgD family transcriptional regulator
MDNALPLGTPILPVPRTTLIGRETEIARARALLLTDAVPLLSLTGPGGVGKTRLALAIAHDVVPHFHDGAVFVDLAPLSNPDLVLPAVTRMLGVVEDGTQPLSQRLIATLQRRCLLLVLDNCEHLLIAVAELISPLLAACPDLQVLSTSRAPLRIRGEHELPVEPLPLPPLDFRQALDLTENPAMQLFIERARAVDPRFSTTNDTLQTVAEICRELDGLPLALELAAARIRALPLSALRDRLQHRLPVLEGGARDAPARQRTMRETIAWSYSLLTPDEQSIFRHLAVFSGGFTLEAVQAVASRQPTLDVLPQLERLVEHNLVRRDERASEPRYQILETIREFALEQLVASGDGQAIRQAHSAYFLALAEHAAPALYGSQQLEWLTQLETDHPNLRAALEWFRDQEESESLLRLGAALWKFWFIRGYYREGRAWLAQGLATAHLWSPVLREALHGASMLASNQGDHHEAAELADQLLTLAQAHDDDEAAARALFLLSFAATYRNDRDQALSFANQALAIFRDLGNPHPLADILNRLGIEEHNQGNYTRAASLYEEVQATWRDLGCIWELVCVTTNLGVTAQAQGNLARAAAQYRESLEFLQDVGETWMIEELLALVAALAAETGDWERAARLIGATDYLLEAIGFALAPFVAVFYEGARASVRRELGEETFTTKRETGRRLTRTQALNEAYAVVSALAEPPVLPDPVAASGLSPRERQVLRLLVEGHSDRQIAETLSISPKTASNHVSSILAKLGVETRTAAAAHAVRRHLV